MKLSPIYQNRYLKLIGTILILLSLVSCSPKFSSYINPGYSNFVGELPSDVCYVNEMAIVYGVSTESDGDMALVYLRNNGDIVTKHFPINFSGTDWKEGGEFYITGGVCPDETDD